MRKFVSFILCAALEVAGLASAPIQASPSEQRPGKSLAELKERIQGDNRNNPVASIRWAEEALQRLASEPDPATEAWIITNLVRDLNTLCDYPKAESYLAQGRKLVARAGNPRSHFLLEIEAAALLEATEGPLDARGLLDGLLPALESFRSENRQDREIGRSLGRGHRIRGAVLQTMGRYPEAINAYQRAQKISEELGDQRGMAIVLNQMGTLYAYINRTEEAVASHQQAIQMAADLSDAALQAAFTVDLATTYGIEKNTELQLAALNRALTLAIKADDLSTQVTGMVNLADAYLRKKDYKATLKYAEAALRLPATVKDPGAVAACQVNRGIALNRLGNSAEGIKAIQEGIRHIKSSQDKARVAEATGNLAEEFAFAGDYRKAYEAEREFKSLSDALQRTEDQQHIAEASAAFESDKKQIQIQGLQRERRVQARLTMLWIALGILGLSAAGVLVLNRKRLQKANRALTALNDQNLELIEQLQAALSEVRTLQGLIPICSHCKKIRDDEGFWSQMESYIQHRTEAMFSHGICPECESGLKAEFERLFPDNS
jgi:tetratricopeptide (TPR) repeat protein